MSEIKQQINDVIQFLIDKELDNPANMILINQLEYNLILADRLKAEIEKKGLIINQGTRYRVANPALVALNRVVTSISSLCSKLAIPPDQRKKLGLDPPKIDTAQKMIDDFMNDSFQ